MNQSSCKTVGGLASSPNSSSNVAEADRSRKKRMNRNDLFILTCETAAILPSFCAHHTSTHQLISLQGLAEAWVTSSSRRGWVWGHIGWPPSIWLLEVCLEVPGTGLPMPLLAMCECTQTHTHLQVYCKTVLAFIIFNFTSFFPCMQKYCTFCLVFCFCRGQAVTWGTSP